MREGKMGEPGVPGVDAEAGSAVEVEVEVGGRMTPLLFVRCRRADESTDLRPEPGVPDAVLLLLLELEGVVEALPPPAEVARPPSDCEQLVGVGEVSRGEGRRSRPLLPERCRESGFVPTAPPAVPARVPT